MNRRSPWLVFALLLVGVVGWAGVRAAPEPRGRGAILIALLVALAASWRRAAPSPSELEGQSAGRTTAMRTALVSAALACAAMLGPSGMTLVSASVFAATAAATSALALLSRLPSTGGLIEPRRGTRDRAYAVLAALIGLGQTALLVGRAAGFVRWPRDPFALIASSASVCGAELALLTVVTAHLARLRRLEIGVRERLVTSFRFALACLLTGFPVALLGPSGREAKTLAVVTTLASLLILASALARDPVVVDRLQRTLVTLAVVAGPIALGLASVSFRLPYAAPAATALGVGLGALVALLAPWLQSASPDDRTRWLDALARAGAALEGPNTDETLSSALLALGDAASPLHGTAELFCFAPPEVVVVDRAGYLHRSHEADVPADLIRIATKEPACSVSAAVVESLEVQRVDVRRVAAWMRERGAFSATLLLDGKEPTGLLLMPSLGRSSPLSLEEARALRGFAGRLAERLSTETSLATSLGREVEARAQAERERARAEGSAEALRSRGVRNALLAEGLAHGARIATYSQASRRTSEQLETAAKEGSAIALLTPCGVDPTPYAALAHLASPRREGPLFVFDPTTLAGRDAELWNTPETSPLASARGGTLCVTTAAALSAEAQSALALALVRGREGTDPPFMLILSVTNTVDALAAAGHMTEALADAVGDRAVRLPPLAARAEDLRAILLDRAARVGLRVRAEPLGLEPGALVRLLEHAWPGNDAEVEDVLARLAVIAEGGRVTRADLDRVGFFVVPVPSPSRRAARSSPPPPGDPRPSSAEEET